MTIMFYVRVIIFGILVSFMIYKRWKKIAIYAWRVGFIYSVLDLSMILFISLPLTEWMYSFMLLFQCVFSMPLLSQHNTCDFCGHRMYWHTLYSNKCPNCGKKVY